MHYEILANCKDNCCDNIISALNQAITDEIAKLFRRRVKIRDILCFICGIYVSVTDGQRLENTFQTIKIWKEFNLHSLFDSGIINYTNLNFEKLFERKNGVEIAEIQVVDVVNWSG
jgi:hypothetical protein